MLIVRDENPQTLSGKVCRGQRDDRIEQVRLTELCSVSSSVDSNSNVLRYFFCFSELSLMRAQE